MPILFHPTESLCSVAGARTGWKWMGSASVSLWSLLARRPSFPLPAFLFLPLLLSKRSLFFLSSGPQPLLYHFLLLDCHFALE